MNKNHYIGVPCRRGHNGLRYKGNGGCVECAKASSKNWRTKNPEKWRGYAMKYNHKMAGIPKPTRPQPEKCECCGQLSKHPLHVDHDHETGAFRGWLCKKCNLAIGGLGDNKQGLQRAMDYLDGQNGPGTSS